MQERIYTFLLHNFPQFSTADSLLCLFSCRMFNSAIVTSPVAVLRFGVISRRVATLVSNNSLSVCPSLGIYTIREHVSSTQVKDLTVFI